MGWVFYFLLIVIAAMAGYKIGEAVTNDRWINNFPIKRKEK
jgi:hypothetical protein